MKKWIISNHKNALTDNRINDYINELDKLKLDNINLVICPKDEHLKLFNNNNYEIGTQDINISLTNMKELNVKYCIVGHSYFRKKYHETNSNINEKIKQLINSNIIPILCIGEEEDSDINNTIIKELKECLANINGNIIIAYEPIWAIGSGKIPNIENLKQIIKSINKQSTSILGKEVPILYGGSVNEQTIIDLNKVEELAGYIISSASLEIEKLAKIIEVIK